MKHRHDISDVTDAHMHSCTLHKPNPGGMGWDGYTVCAIFVLFLVSCVAPVCTNTEIFGKMQDYLLIGASQINKYRCITHLINVCVCAVVPETNSQHKGINRRFHSAVR